MSRNPALFYGAIIVAILAVLLAIYYAIPSIDHVLVSGGSQGTHIKHVAAFVAIAVIAVLGALVTRPKRAL